MNKNKVIIKESLISWLFFIFLILIMIFLPIICILFFIFNIFPIILIKYIILGTSFLLIMIIPNIMKSPLEIDFNNRFIIIKNIMNYEFNGSVGKFSTTNGIKINFDDLLDLKVRGLSTKFISISFVSLILKINKNYDGEMKDLTEGKNAINVPIYFITYKSRKELFLSIKYLKNNYI